MQSKRGISTIVGTMMVLLITIVIAGILWYFVNNSFNKSKGELNNDCLSLQLEPIKCEADAICGYIGGRVGYKADVIVKRNPGEGDLREVRLVFEDLSQKAFLSDEGASNFVELQSKNFKDINVQGVYPGSVKVSALVGNSKSTCPIVASPVKCTLRNTPPALGATPDTPTTNDCCQYPWNLTECSPGAGGSSYCCDHIPPGYPSVGSSCPVLSPGKCSGDGITYCDQTTPCSQTAYPGQYCNYPYDPNPSAPVNTCCINPTNAINCI